MNGPTKVVRFAVVGVTAVYSGLLYFSGVQLDSWGKQVIGALPLIAALLLATWDAWLWRVPGVQVLTGRPRLDGLWRLTLRPTAESHIPEGGNRGPLPGFIVVTQSFWSVHVRQLTTESSSDSQAFFWDRPNGSDVERLAFIFANEPRQEYQHRSQRHLGACSFTPASLVPTTMTGMYFTDRYTKGDMDLTFVDRSRGHATFAAAEEYAASGQSARKPRWPKGFFRASR